MLILAKTSLVLAIQSANESGNPVMCAILFFFLFGYLLYSCVFSILDFELSILNMVGMLLFQTKKTIKILGRGGSESAEHRNTMDQRKQRSGQSCQG
jgi:hypothetical protein